MKNIALRLAVLAAGITTLAAPGLLRAAETVRYSAIPLGSKIRMEGTSTVHDWAVESTFVGGFMELPADFPLDASKPLPPALSAMPKVEVSIPVERLHNDKKSVAMDDRMYLELKTKEYPRIEYRLKEMKPGKAEAGKTSFDTKGDLTVAGATNLVSMPIAFEKQADGKVKVTGAVTLKMSDFKIPPPTFTLLGLSLMKTGDEIKLSFEWMTAPKAAAPPAAK